MADGEQTYSARRIGGWDTETKRYVPMGGGSRSRLELTIKGLRPYRGFSGVDSLDKVKIDSIATLYAKLDQGLQRIAQSNAYLSALEVSREVSLEAERIAAVAAAELELEQKAQAAAKLKLEREAQAAAAREKSQVEQEAKLQLEAEREEPINSMQPQVADEAAGASMWGIPENFEL